MRFLVWVATDINCNNTYTRDLGAPFIEVAWRSARQVNRVIERERADADANTLQREREH